MNKITSINLGGYPFSIDEDAYLHLSQYLQTLNQHFANSEGCEEIMSDIESRLAELFREQLGSRSILTRQDVKNAISVMGTPEDFGIDGEKAAPHKSTEGQKSQHWYIKTGRRLFRDLEDKKLAGVCSGVAAFFGISDPLWVRLAFVLFTLLGGSGIFVYALLWLIVPTAKSTADRLEMRGEPINIENIARAVEEGAESFSKRINDLGGQAQARQFAGKAEYVIHQIGAFLAEVLRGIFRLIRPIATILSVIMLIGLVIASMGLLTGVTLMYPFFEYITPTKSTFWSTLLTTNLIAIVSIPILSLIFWLRRLIYHKSITPSLSWGLGILFTVNVVSIFTILPMIGRQFAQSVELKSSLNIPKQDNKILNLELKNDKTSDSNIGIGPIKWSDEQLWVRDVNFRLEKSENGQIELIQTRFSNGGTRSEATELNNLIQCPMSVSGDTISVMTGFAIPKGYKYRGQSVEYLLRLPVGQKVKLNEAQRNDSNNDFWAQDFWDYFDEGEDYNKVKYTTWIMTEKGIQLDMQKKKKAEN